MIDLDKVYTDPEVRLTAILLPEYQNSPVYKEWIGSTQAQLTGVYKAIASCQDRYLEYGYGVQLDVLASLVGASRVLKGVPAGVYYGFEESAGTLGMGDLDDPSLQAGTLRGESQAETSDLTLSDDRLVNLIYARINKNAKSRTRENALDYLGSLIGSDTADIEITLPEARHTRVDIHETLDAAQLGILSVYAADAFADGIHVEIWHGSPLQQLQLRGPQIYAESL